MAETNICPDCGAAIPAGGAAEPCVGCLLLLAGAADGSAETKPAAPPPSPDSPLGAAPESFGDYDLLEEIGRGGMGVVWKARQLSLNRLVALKLIKPGMDSVQVLARFDAERQALALMDHPNIARVIDAGTTPDGWPYFVMELVEGVPILGFCDERRLTIRERLELFIQVCQAIQHAHQKGVIHRDIKPGNVLVTVQDGQAVPKVIDFGIAKAMGSLLTPETVVTEIGALLGTLEYMSPEQTRLNSLDIDTRSDIYSLGILLYELLTGTTPLDRKTLKQAAFDELLRRVREEEPHKPSTRLNETHTTLPAIAAQRGLEPSRLPRVMQGDVDWIVMKALEKDRNRRYETANGLATDIRRHLNNEPVVARPPSNLYRFQKMVRRNKFAFAAATAVAASVIIGFCVSTWLFLREKEAQRTAEEKATEAKLTLAASDFSQATHSIAVDEFTEALPYLVRSLRGNRTNMMAVTRLATLLSYHSWPLPIATIQESNEVFSVRFAPDGRRIVIASGQAARVWDVESSQPLAPAFVHLGPIYSVQFSPDGMRVATGSDDGTAMIWNSETGARLAGPFKHSGAVRSAQFSADGNSIITASFDQTVCVWDAQAGQLLAGPLRHSSPVLTAQLSSDGKRIVTGSSDSKWRIWDVQTGKVLMEIASASGWPVESARFTSDGSRILTVDWGGSPRQWDSRTGQMFSNVFHIGGVSLGLAQFSPEGREFVHAGRDRFARVWDYQTLRPRSETFHHGTRVKNVEMSPDSKLILTATTDEKVHVWNVGGSTAVPTKFKHVAAINSAQFSPDGRWVLTTCDDKKARLWDAGSGVQQMSLAHDGRVTTGQFSPDGRRIVTASDDKSARVWSVSPKKSQTGPLLHLKHAAKVTSAQFSPDGRRILTVSENETTGLWETETGKPLATLLHSQPVRFAHFSPDGLRIITVTSDGTAHLWYVEEQLGRERSGNPRFTFGNGVGLAAFNGDGTRIVTEANSFEVHVWDSQTGQACPVSIREPAWPGSLQFSPDGRRILTTSWSVGARIWDAQTGQPVTEIMKHFHSWVFATFSPALNWVATASWDRTARVWDAETGQALTDPLMHDGAVNLPEFSSDGKRVLTYGGDAAYIWDLVPAPETAPDWIIELGEAVSGQVVNKRGQLEATTINRTETIKRIREQLRRTTEDDDWAIWGRWFLADSSARTISPFSKARIAEQSLRPGMVSASPRSIEKRLRRSSFQFP